MGAVVMEEARATFLQKSQFLLILREECRRNCGNWIEILCNLFHTRDK